MAITDLRGVPNPIVQSIQGFTQDLRQNREDELKQQEFLQNQRFNNLKIEGAALENDKTKALAKATADVISASTIANSLPDGSEEKKIAEKTYLDKLQIAKNIQGTFVNPLVEKLGLRHVESEIEKNKAEALKYKKEAQYKGADPEKTLRLQNLLLDLEKKRTELKGSKPPGEAMTSLSALAAINSGVQDMQSLYNNLDIKGPLVGSVRNLIKNFTNDSLATKLNSSTNLIGQQIAKAIEKSRLTDADRVFYLKQIPSISDSPKVFKAKLDVLNNLLENARQGELQTLKESGVNIQGFDLNQTPPKSEPAFNLEEFNNILKERGLLK